MDDQVIGDGNCLVYIHCADTFPPFFVLAFWFGVCLWGRDSNGSGLGWIHLDPDLFNFFGSGPRPASDPLGLQRWDPDPDQWSSKSMGPDCFSH